MKVKAFMNCDILCGQCCHAMYPMTEFLPKRIVYCPNEKCQQFHMAVEVKPFEVEVVPVDEILHTQREK